MDGNGRWARKRGLPRHAGHRAGVKAVRTIVETAAQRGIRYLTLFAFSSENWSRPKEEVGKLMGLFVEALRREVDELHKNDVKLRFVGARHQLDDGLVAKIAAAEERTAGNTGLELLVAVAYGGRWDIVEAVREIAAGAAAGEISPEEVGEDAIAGRLQLAGVPDPDLLIRTGGEQRISNFLLWNLAYSELFFPDVLWPDFTDKHLDEALTRYAQCERRFGATGEQVKAIGC
ncbi:MAG: polyprenyl diphosphate synthase [Woeseiaceae bacterium]|nr:polyprenyl diphosphate synthase [Woeseiaceae bacterium]